MERMNENNTLYDNPDLEALFSFKHSCTNTGRYYDFSYAGSTADNATYYWTFQNGTPSYSTDQNPLGILFGSTGYKFITLTVNRNGCESSIGDTVLISNVLIGDDSVMICHLETTEITIHVDSLNSHLAHGDCIGPCSSSARFINTSLLTLPDLNLSLSPNPMDNMGVIQISGSIKEDEDISIELLDFTGNKVRKIFSGLPFEKSNLLNIKILTSDLLSGLYLISLRNGLNMINKKLIVQHR